MIHDLNNLISEKTTKDIIKEKQGSIEKIETTSCSYSDYDEFFKDKGNLSANCLSVNSLYAMLDLTSDQFMCYRSAKDLDTYICKNRFCTFEKDLKNRCVEKTCSWSKGALYSVCEIMEYSCGSEFYQSKYCGYSKNDRYKERKFTRVEKKINNLIDDSNKIVYSKPLDILKKDSFRKNW